ncbi:DNA polymerase [uncultured Anaerovibrio sp.]|uniref:DNA polymerase n=1 Tax=uncultured Anaerovibrio sp. TaxID=361586 RepID=UPI002624D54A|nr:DNA polymerase [uncultured Anaerovibrio sp.]
MNTISIDLETYSDVDIGKCGVYKYAESPNFEILLFAYSVDGGGVTVIDITNGEKIPDEIISALSDHNITKWAFNSQFERICLSEYLHRHYSLDTHYLSPASWKCSMTWCAYMGLPMSLAGAGAILGLEQQKITEGKELIRYFCVPCKPTKANGGRTRNLPIHDKDKWDRFKKYNIRDVEVEMAIQDRLQKFPVPDFVWEEFWLDQQINDRGIAVDMEFAKNAISFDAKSREALMDEIKDITGLDNPNSVMQLKDWLIEQGMEVTSLDKKAVSAMLPVAPPNVQKVLGIRKKLAKSSVKKYQAMENAVCKDGRARGMFRFYGANRTGRFAGRLIQLQNLPQNHISDLAEARKLVKAAPFEVMELLYDDIPDTLSQLIRTAFVPQDGYKFIVADFSAIEARVLAYLAGEQWVLDTFARGEDIYCATASRMFHCTVVKNGENGELRQKGKQATLSCGYGGSVGALIAMGALESGMREEELQPLVDAWRKANPNIVNFWWAVDRAVKEAVIQHTTTSTHGIKFICKSGMLFIELPSGRRLSYVKPRMGVNKFGSESVTYEGTNGTTKKWERLESYGPKFVENIVQGTSRDILMFAMKNLSELKICGHVHDEVIVECRPDISVDTICKIMGQAPTWTPGLLLRADGYECDFYKKD